MEEIFAPILAYAKETYGIAEDYPWGENPAKGQGSAVLRHPENGKWFGLMMFAPARAVGLSGNAPVPVLTVKADPVLSGSFMGQPGIYPGYHMNHSAWMTLALDGRLAMPTICQLLDLSFNLTAPKGRKSKDRLPQEWLIPANPAYYDVDAGFAAEAILSWHQTANMRAGDTVYIYMAAPTSAILHKCLVTEADLPGTEEDGKKYKRSMNLKRICRYPEHLLPRSLMQRFGVNSVRGPRSVPYGLSAAIAQAEREYLDQEKGAD